MTPATVAGTGAGRGPDSETEEAAMGGSDSETDGIATIGETDGATTTGVDAGMGADGSETTMIPLANSQILERQRRVMFIEHGPQ